MAKTKKLKIPSLQHLARLWRPDVERVRRTLVSLARNSPTFSYQIVYELVHDLVYSKLPYAQVENAVRDRVRVAYVREKFLEILPLIESHFSDVKVDFVHQVAPRFYPLGRDLLIPFTPSFVYGAQGKLHLPWFSFWRENPLDSERLSLFMSVVDEVLAQDPDLEGAEFSILDFSAVDSKSPRTLKVIPSSEIPRVSAERRTEMLGIFIAGFRLAQEDLAKIGITKEPVLEHDEDQLPLL